MMTRLAGALLLSVGLAPGATTDWAGVMRQGPSCGDQSFAEAQVSGSPRLDLELARTLDERVRGLMGRTSMPPDRGMLFIFDQRGSGAFWNMNTLIPLSVAYLESDGTIVDIQDMRPHTPGAKPDLYPPAAPYLYALEVNQGWFVRHGVSVGDVLRICLVTE
jgi:uncharacterized membrane protein (UPF0127 family)